MIHVNDKCIAFNIISIISVTGEFPSNQLWMLGNHVTYRRMVSKMLKTQTYLNDATKEKVTVRALSEVGHGSLKTLRLLASAEPILKWINANEYYGEAYRKHNFPGGERLLKRNILKAESVAMVKAAGYEYRPYVMPKLRLEKRAGKELSISHNGFPNRFPNYPAFYPARELKGPSDDELKKTVFTRFTGAIFYNKRCIPIYNIGREEQKYFENAEIKMRYTLTEINKVNGSGYEAYSCIFLADDELYAIKTLRYIYNKRHNRHKDCTGSKFYLNVHFIPLSKEGIRQLRFFQIEDFRYKLQKWVMPSILRDYTYKTFIYFEKKFWFTFLDGNIADLISAKKEMAKAPARDYVFICFPHQKEFLRKFISSKVNLFVVKLENAEKILELR